MKKWMMIPALAGVVVIGGVAMATNAEQSLAAEQKGLLTVEEVETIAVKSAGGKVMGIELDRERQGDVYEVEVQSDGIEYDLDIDAKTGKVLRTDKDDMDDDDQDDMDDDNQDDNVVPTDEKFITQEAATEIAMKQAKGTVSKIELDNDDGHVIYEIEIKDDTYEYDFDIDAISGEVLEFEKDRDDD